MLFQHETECTYLSCVTGKTYLAFNKADNMWQRCRVIQVDKRDPTKQPLVEVFFFDFGSSEIVTIDRYVLYLL